VGIFFSPQAAGASSARHSLRPLSGERNETDKTSRENKRRDREVISRRHCERSEAIHSLFLLRDGLLRFARNDVDGLFEINPAVIARESG
jgi:hypothetical protein